MVDIEARLDELTALGISRRTRLVSGPQGPHVLVDGEPELLLCSANCLGLADHPRVRSAAADAAMRWGVGAGGSRLVSGTMTVHRRLEERLARFTGRQSALLFGSGYLAGVGAVATLARPGDVVFCDERSNQAAVDGCRLSGAEVFVYDHCDTDHLEWGVQRAEGRAALIVTDAVFSIDGDVAPLAEIVDIAQRHDVRTIVDESHGLGALGPEGRGALAEAGCNDEVDLIVSSLSTALGGYGGFVACDRTTARYLVNSARTLAHSAAPAPPAAAAALAALELLVEEPRRRQRLVDNAEVLRAGLRREGFVLGACRTHIVTIVLGDPHLAARMHAATLARGILTEVVGPPTVPATTARLRLTVMATHRPEELDRAAATLATAARCAGIEPADTSTPLPLFDTEAADGLELLPEDEPLGDALQYAPSATAVFDHEADGPVRRAA